MRRIAALIAIMLVSTLYASTITSDGSFPDYAMAAIGRAVDEPVDGDLLTVRPLRPAVDGIVSVRKGIIGVFVS